MFVTLQQWRLFVKENETLGNETMVAFKLVWTLGTMIQTLVGFFNCGIFLNTNP